jgi:hypothetical protein
LKMKKQTLLIMAFLSAALGAFAQQGIIKELTGTVELKPAGASAFVSAKQGDTVAQNTVISTGFKSTAVITVGSATITVKPITRLSLAEISQGQGSERLGVNLQAGRIRAEVKPPAGMRADMSVKGPSVTASVRGTEFELDTYSLTVIEGTVAFSGTNGGIMMVSGGGSSHVDPVTLRAVDPVIEGAAALRPLLPVGADEKSVQAGGKESIDTAKVEFSLELSF